MNIQPKYYVKYVYFNVNISKIQMKTIFTVVTVMSYK